MSLHRRAAKRDANEAALVEQLQAAGCYVNQISSTGVPDLLCTHPNGKYFCVEVKARGGKLTDGQKEFMAKARQRDALAFVCQTSDDVRLALSVVSE